MPDTEDLPADRSARRKRGCWWACLIAALIALLPVFYVFGAFYRLEEVSGSITYAPSGCEVSVNQAGNWKSEMLIFGLPAENLEYPLKVMIFVERCPGVPNGEPYTLQLMQRPSGQQIATGLDCGDVPQSSHGLCRVEVPPIPTRAESHQFVLKIVGRKGDPPEEVPVSVVLTRQWRSIAWSALMSV